jgi:hypothetical protein
MKTRKSRCPYILKVVLAGLLISHIAATVHVYHSNLEFEKQLKGITEAGYFPIPNLYIQQQLTSFLPAFCGALFFTLTVGTGLTLLSLSCAWIWDRLLFRSKFFIYYSSFLLAAFLCYGLISQKLTLIASAYFLIVPINVFFLATRLMPELKDLNIRFVFMTHLFPYILLLFLWAPQLLITQYRDQLYPNVRDYLLLSNPVGLAVNDFYYKYTMYPAQSFKSLEKKNLKPCHIEGVNNSSELKRLKARLFEYDYIEVDPANVSVLNIVKDKNKLIFINSDRALVSTTYKNFISDPEPVLQKFSSGSDRIELLRAFTGISLILGFPFTLYIIVHSLIRFLSGYFFNPGPELIFTGAACFLIGLFLFFPVWQGAFVNIDLANMDDVLTIDNWKKRVTGMRIIEEKRMDPEKFHGHKRMINSPYVPERYWLARALANSKSKESFDLLLAFLDDPHPNVVCQAFNSMGQRGNKDSIKMIQDRIASSDHWYIQWYAYKALRQLGWTQEDL